MARALDYGVMICDPRPEHVGGFALEGVSSPADMPTMW